jgi:hypothetical protein
LYIRSSVALIDGPLCRWAISDPPQYGQRRLLFSLLDVPGTTPQADFGPLLAIIVGVIRPIVTARSTYLGKSRLLLIGSLGIISSHPRGE